MKTFERIVLGHFFFLIALVALMALGGAVNFCLTGVWNLNNCDVALNASQFSMG